MCCQDNNNAGGIQLQPAGSRILISEVEEIQIHPKNSHLIHFASAINASLPLQGKIVTMGAECDRGWNDGGKREVGAMVIFGRYAGVAVQLEGVKYLLLKEEEVLGYLVKKENNT